MADLLRALPESGEHLLTTLDAVLILVRASCPSCVAVSLTLDHEGQPVTVSATVGNRQRHAAAMTVRLPPLAADRPGRRQPVIVVFATDALALARLALDISVLPEIDARDITLAPHAPVPTSTTASIVLVGQLADRAQIDRALGALVEQGWVPAQGRRELQRRADDAGTSLLQAAATVLAALPDVPPER